jgi:O-antigen/teichoic acid export membrane protein
MSIRKLAGETAIYGLSSLVGRLLYFLLTPMYTRIFPTEEYGIVTDLFAYIGFAMVLFTYRMEVAYFRFGADSEADRKRSFDTAQLSIILSTIALGVLFLALSPWMADLSKYPGRSVLVQLAVAILCLDALAEVPFARLRMERRAVKFAAIRLLNISVNLGANLFFLVFCPYALKSQTWQFMHPIIESLYDPAFGIGYIFLSNVLASLTSVLLLLPQMRGLRFSIDWAHWRRMMRYALPLVVVGFSYVINEMFDRKAMIYLLPGSAHENHTQLGIYGANYKLAMLLALFTQAFRYAAEPFFFRVSKKTGSLQVYADVAKYFAIIGVLGFLGVMLYIDLLKYFIGPQYWSGLGVVPVLLLANLFLGLYTNFSTWYKLTDRTDLGAYISIGGALITIVLNLWWVPVFSYTGAAWATLICYTSMAVACLWIGRKYLPVPYPVGRISLYIVLGLAFFFLSEKWRPLFSEKWLLLLANTALLGAFAAVTALLEKDDLKKILRRKKN